MTVRSRCAPFDRLRANGKTVRAEPVEARDRIFGWRARGAPLLLALLLAGCIFHDAPAPRYFAPPSALATTPDPPADPSASTRLVRLRRLRSASYLGEQIAWRVSDVERGLYEQRRWTEFPSRYVERAVAQAIDREPGVRRVDGGRVPTLDLELVSFDEVLAPAHEAEVEVFASLRSADQATIFEQVFAARQPIADQEPASAARAMGAALDAVAQQIAAQVAAETPVAPTRAQR
jgi:ABC-type uncharacterized transport system auxiliary subunit